MWWINANEKWKGVSPKVYFAAGFGGNYIVIDTANDLVVVTRWMDDSKMAEFMNLVEQSIIMQSNRK
jgi:CubicO group peptidase (beta-lactamase class C family)